MCAIFIFIDVTDPKPFYFNHADETLIITWIVKKTHEEEADKSLAL
jgi:hypothetical protein